MRPKQITVTGVGTSPWLPVDYKQSPMNLGVGVVLVSGTVTYNVEYTFDDVFNPAVTPTAFVLAGMSGGTTSANSVINTPIRAVRLNVTGGTSPVTTMTIIQGQR